ncbi:N4-gp56 family major capsid protein [Pseudolactococcus reticulitermitis]|uniref:Major capsid protein n=1 Tax=Pseudolactococcus reticulitermitis TaxID=2025039 RepID=A0A224X9A9_9LACT|nr:N4-gp56 family major capsid protein [Lactococcus reticulitermitis]GAX46774.1 hypothetical protein RsY01_353 [Lactococcus reticulitermitis]
MNKQFKFKLFDVGTTKVENTVVPEVMADMISAKIPHKLRFIALAKVDTTLVGQPGNTITVPSWSYIGDAEDVAEGAAIPTTKMESSTKQMTIKKAAKGVKITDEARLSAIGDPFGEATDQLAKAIAGKIDTDLIAAASETTQHIVSGTGVLKLAKLQAAIDVFADEDYQNMLLITTPANATALRDEFLAANKGADVTANIQIKGAFANILGVDIIRSAKITTPGFLFKITADPETEEIEPALRIVMKRDIQVEADRDINTKTTEINADEHYGAYLYDETKIVKFVETTP